MDQPRRTDPLPLLFVTTLIVFLAFGAWNWSLHVQLDLAEVQNGRLRQRLESRATAASVTVVCECPAYEDGWDDAEFADGCYGEVELTDPLGDGSMVPRW